MYRYSALWIFWAVWATASGWILSALHLLNGVGYFAAAIVGLGVLLLGLRQAPRSLKPRRTAAQMAHRFARGLRLRPLQALFAVLCLAIFIGGACHIPWSFDATTYRLPRILYWWAHNGWYWTNSPDNRMDYSSVGFEWEMLPVLLLAKSDRFLFLLNWIPYLFVPSLLLRFLRAFRVQRALMRVLIWVIPAGYCFALQAGGIENDGYVVVYLLAAFAFLDAYARRARPFDLFVSLLAAALLTGAKFSNVFLLLPYGLMLGSILLRRNEGWATLLAAALPSLLVSFVPLTTLCYLNTGDISGDPHNLLGLKSTHPVQTLVSNLVLMAEDAAQPPYVPAFKSQLDALAERFNQTAFWQSLKSGHPDLRGISFGEFVYEGGAGLGMGVVGMVLLAVVLRLPCILNWQSPYSTALLFAVALASWSAFLISLSLISSDSMARISAPYYPLLIATLPWMSGRSSWDRSRLLSAAGGIVLLSSLFLVLIAPIRPAVPMLTVLRYLVQERQVSALQSTLDKYEFWAGLRDNLSAMRAALPSDGEPIGYAGAYRETSYGLWKPIGSRKIFELVTPDPRDLERSRNVHIALVTENGLQKRFGMSLSEWLQHYRVHPGPVFWFNASLTAKSKPNLSEWMLVTWK